MRLKQRSKNLLSPAKSLSEKAVKQRERDLRREHERFAKTRYQIALQSVRGPRRECHF